MQQLVEEFLNGCREPGVLEHGDELIALRPGDWSTDIQSGRLTIHVLSETHSVSRRIVAVEKRQSACLFCLVERFGGRTTKFALLDLAKPQSAVQTLHGRRRGFSEKFRRMLQRHFPDWQIASLTSEMDLTRSFSPVFPRAVLEQGSKIQVAIACPSLDDEPALLTFALLWHDHVRRRSLSRRRQMASPTLALFLPDVAGQLTAQRLRHLSPLLAGTRLFRFNEHGSAGEVDLTDLGNLEASLQHWKACPLLEEWQQEFLESLAGAFQVNATPRPDGSLSLRVNGWEFAQFFEGKFFAVNNSSELSVSGSSATVSRRGHPLSALDVESLAGELFLRRNSVAADRHHPLFRASSEAWLEAAVRSNLELIDATLIPQSVHSEVLIHSGLARGRSDLLAVSHRGRLSVLELKATEDIHLAMQAFDYWCRIASHAKAGTLDALFPGISVSREEPRLLLIAPAISFHPAIDTILRYFPTHICVERVGLNLEWKDELKVVLRLAGSKAPVSHEV